MYRQSTDANQHTVNPLPVEERSQSDADSHLLALLDQYELPLYKFAFVRLGDRDLAMDCAQETFVRAYQNLRRGKPVNAQWLYRVARNLATDEYRRRRRYQYGDGLDAIPAPMSDLDLPHAMRQAFSSLSPDDRSLLYLTAVEGRNTIEISDMLGIRPTTVRMRLSRARERFRRTYGGAS